MATRKGANDASAACQGPECGKTFVPQRSTARYCSATCRQRAGRAKKAAAQSTEADAKTGKDDHPLVRAVKNELEAASKVETFNGQLAIQLARKLTNPDESGATALSKELRSVMAAALEAAAPAETVANEGAAEDDEVKRAREIRERKAREAAAH